MAAAAPREDYGKILQLKEGQILNGENYANWVIFMQPVLYEARCFQHIFPANARLLRPVTQLDVD